MDRIIDTHVHVWDPSALDYGWLSGDFDRRVPAGRHPPCAGRRHRHDLRRGGLRRRAARGGVGRGAGLAGAGRHRREGRPVARGRDRRAASTRSRRSTASSACGGTCRTNRSRRSIPPVLLAGLQQVAKRELTFDACVRHHQLPALRRLVARVPELLVVLDHLGKPDASRPPAPEWQESLLALAGLPNVSIKLSGVPPEADPERAIGPQAAPSSKPLSSCSARPAACWAATGRSRRPHPIASSRGRGSTWCSRRSARRRRSGRSWAGGRASEFYGISVVVA